VLIALHGRWGTTRKDDDLLKKKDKLAPGNRPENRGKQETRLDPQGLRAAKKEKNILTQGEEKQAGYRSSLGLLELGDRPPGEHLFMGPSPSAVSQPRVRRGKGMPGGNKRIKENRRGLSETTKWG